MHRRARDVLRAAQDIKYARALLFRMGIDGESHQIGYQKAVKPQKHLSPSKDKAQLRKKADSTQEGSR